VRDAGHDARSGSLAIIAVVRHEQPDFQKKRAGINEFSDALPCGELPRLVLFFDLLCAASGAKLVL